MNENIKLIITKFFRRNAFWCLRLVSPRFTSKKTQKKALLTGILLAFFVTAMLLHTDFSSFNLYEEAYDTSENLQSPDLHNRATYVTDSEENWIINGTFEDQWGGLGTTDGKFYFPMFIAVDSSGLVYVTDKENNRVQKFSK